MKYITKCYRDTIKTVTVQTLKNILQNKSLLMYFKSTQCSPNKKILNIKFIFNLIKYKFIFNLYLQKNKWKMMNNLFALCD